MVADTRSAAKRARPAALASRVTTIKLPALGRIYSLVAGQAGMLFVGTRSALYLLANGRIALCAGHPSETAFRDGHSVEARFNTIAGLAIERDGSVIVSDTYNHCLRRVSPLGSVTTVAGNGKAGFADGVGADARFNFLGGIIVNRQGLIYVADKGNHCIRAVQPADGTVSTLCGKPQAGLVNGPAAEARFFMPTGLALDSSDNVIVADCGNNCVRKVALPAGRVTTVAGSPSGGAAGKGFADGEEASARFYSPHAIAIVECDAVLVADTYNQRLRMITGERACVTTMAGSEHGGNKDGVGPAARFNMPTAMTMDEHGRLVVSDYENKGCLRVVETSLAPCDRTCNDDTDARKALLALQTDYGKLLQDHARADVTFVVDKQRFPAHSCILAARSEHFSAQFDWEQRKGADIALEGVSAGAFRVLLRYLYTQELPAAEDCGEGLAAGEMVKAADYFQAGELYEHCVEQFKGQLRVGNVVERMVYAHDSQLEVLVEAAMQYLRTNVLEFQVRLDQWIVRILSWWAVDCHFASLFHARLDSCRIPSNTFWHFIISNTFWHFIISIIGDKRCRSEAPMCVFVSM